MISKLQKQYANNIIKPYLEWYLKKPRTYEYDDLNLKIYPGVFHPHYFFSTLFFVSFLKDVEVKDRHFCEVGAGSGLVSFLASKRGAQVTAIELNKTAVNGLKENIRTNGLEEKRFNVIESDLFDNVPSQRFDIIYINPPYFFSDVSGEKSMAWNCGANGEYFEKLFLQLANGFYSAGVIYMTLAENCDLPRIRRLAAKQQLKLICVREKKIKWEKNYIFKITHV